MTKPPDNFQDAGRLSFKRLQEFKKDLEPRLKANIEKHLPGDFSAWEGAHTTGDKRTVDATVFSPVTAECAWSVFCAYEYADENLGFVNKGQNMEALNELERCLAEALKALGALDLPTRLNLSKASSERYRASFDTDPKQFVPPDYNLELVVQALRDGIDAARNMLEKEGGVNRANRKAASVISACRKIYEARTGITAPLFAREVPEKKDRNPEPSAFVAFATDIFKSLDLSIRVDSALRRLRIFSN